ncbi:hypothetical protein YN1_8280 [Nanoarchaeota archaeon]
MDDNLTIIQEILNKYDDARKSLGLDKKLKGYSPIFIINENTKYAHMILKIILYL